MALNTVTNKDMAGHNKILRNMVLIPTDEDVWISNIWTRQISPLLTPTLTYPHYLQNVCVSSGVPLSHIDMWLIVIIVMTKGRDLGKNISTILIKIGFVG